MLVVKHVRTLASAVLHGSYRPPGCVSLCLRAPPTLQRMPGPPTLQITRNMAHFPAGLIERQHNGDQRILGPGQGTGGGQGAAKAHRATRQDRLHEHDLA